MFRARGLNFLTIPPAYYDDLRIRLQEAGMEVQEDIDKIQELNILVDFDDTG